MMDLDIFSIQHTDEQCSYHKLIMKLNNNILFVNSVIYTTIQLKQKQNEGAR